MKQSCNYQRKKPPLFPLQAHSNRSHCRQCHFDLLEQHRQAFLPANGRQCRQALDTHIVVIQAYPYHTSCPPQCFSPSRVRVDTLSSQGSVEQIQQRSSSTNLKLFTSALQQQQQQQRPPSHRGRRERSNSVTTTGSANSNTVTNNNSPAKALLSSAFNAAASSIKKMGTGTLGRASATLFTSSSPNGKLSNASPGRSGNVPSVFSGTAWHTSEDGEQVDRHPLQIALDQKRAEMDEAVTKYEYMLERLKVGLWRRSSFFSDFWTNRLHYYYTTGGLQSSRERSGTSTKATSRGA